MASVTVFVDEAVRGDLPPVCAKTGVETPDHLVATVAVGGSGLGAAWLLIFLGPVGWLALFVYGLVRTDETLTVRLPYSDAAYAELASSTRTKRTLGWFVFAAGISAVVVLIGHSFSARAASAVLALAAAGLAVAWFVELLQVRRASVGVALDASRRWVTVSRVCDDFARAVRRRDDDRRSPEHRSPGHRSPEHRSPEHQALGASPTA